MLINFLDVLHNYEEKLNIAFDNNEESNKKDTRTYMKLREWYHQSKSLEKEGI